MFGDDMGPDHFKDLLDSSKAATHQGSCDIDWPGTTQTLIKRIMYTILYIFIYTYIILLYSIAFYGILWYFIVFYCILLYFNVCYCI